MTRASWKSYVMGLCEKPLRLDDRATASLLASLDALSATADFTTQDVARVLTAANVAESTAELIAPSIRVAMAAD